MSSTAGPPEAARVFVGNLVPSITDVALIRLFSRFGDVFKLERDSEKGFAHLSMKPKHNASDDVERCMSSLNRTSWCGTTLRVERAREHFLGRLRREWAEERNQESEEMEVVTETPCGEHFANFKKGNHTRFSFPDLEPCKTNLKDQTEEPDKDNMMNLDSTPAPQKENNANSRKQEGLEHRSSAKSEKLDSTLALFGLSSTSVEDPHKVGSVLERKRQGPPRESSPVKRPRSTVRTEEQGNEQSQDPSLIDITSEKQAARMVLQKLFPAAQATPSGSASCRRLGLYRKLLQTTDAKSNCGEDRAQRREEYRVCIAEPCRYGKASGGSSVDAFRRAGLYRMLQTQAPT